MKNRGISPKKRNGPKLFFFKKIFLPVLLKQKNENIFEISGGEKSPSFTNIPNRGGKEEKKKKRGRASASLAARNAPTHQTHIIR